MCLSSPQLAFVSVASPQSQQHRGFCWTHCWWSQQSIGSQVLGWVALHGLEAPVGIAAIVRCSWWWWHSHVASGLMLWYICCTCFWSPRNLGFPEKMGGGAGGEQVMAKGRVARLEGSLSAELQTLELKCKIIKCPSWTVTLVQSLVTSRRPVVFPGTSKALGFYYFNFYYLFTLKHLEQKFK